MRTVDRVILVTLAAGIWVLVLSFTFNPKIAAAIYPYEIYGLEDAIGEIVENCSVYVHTISGDVYVHTISGEVYVYDISLGEGYGEISSGNGYGDIGSGEGYGDISC